MVGCQFFVKGTLIGNRAPGKDVPQIVPNAFFNCHIAVETKQQNEVQIGAPDTV
jgi:hypothetical protein